MNVKWFVSECTDFLSRCVLTKIGKHRQAITTSPLWTGVQFAWSYHPLPLPGSSSCHLKHLVKPPPLCGSSNLTNSTTSEYLKKLVFCKICTNDMECYCTMKNITHGNCFKSSFATFCHGNDWCIAIGRGQVARRGLWNVEGVRLEASFCLLLRVTVYLNLCFFVFV